MPSLEAVEEAFIADMTRFLAGLDAGIAKAGEFAQACKDAADSAAEITLAAEEMAVAVDASFASAIGSAKALDAQVAETAAAMKLLTGRHVDISASVTGISGPVAGAVAQVEALKAAMAGLDSATVKVSADVGGVAAKTAAAGAGFRIWGTGIRLTSNQLHWLVMGTLEVASTAIPAMVAFGAAAVALYEPLNLIGDRMVALDTASGGLAGALRNSSPPLASLASHLGSLTAQMNSDAFIIFGSVIEDLTARTGKFSSVASGAAQVLTQFATRITADLQGPAGTAIAGFFSNAVRDMVQWGQVLGNLGHAFINVINSMWGVGKLLLDVLVLMSRAFLDLTSNPVIAWMIGLASAMSAAYRWGRLLATIWTWLGGTAAVTAIRALGAQFLAMAADIGVAAAAEQMLFDATAALEALLTGPVAITIGMIAAAVLPAWYLQAHQVSGATQQLITKVRALPPTVQNLTGGIVVLNSALLAQEARLHAVNSSASATRASFKGLGADAARAITAESSANIDALTAAIRKQAQQLVALNAGLAQTGAGVGTVASYENFLSIQTELADSKVQAMNQAFSDFMANVTGGTAGLASFSQALTNLTSGSNRVTTILGRSGSVTLSVKGFAEALKTFTGEGAQAWQNFDQVLNSSAVPLVSWLNTARTEGALTGRQYSKAVLDMASSLTKFAADSPAAQAQLVAFAQASGMNITTFPQLEAAIKRTGADAGDLRDKVEGATVAMANASQIARNMSTILNSQVQQAIAQAALKSARFGMALNGLTQAMEHGSFQGHDLAYWQNRVNTAYNDGMAAAARAAKAISGTSSAQATAAATARQYAAELQQIKLWLDRLHSKTISVAVDIAQSGGGISLPGGGGTRVNPGMAQGGTMRPGWAMVGERGPELLYSPRGGEQVIPHDVSRALLSMAGRMPKITGYAAGTGGFARHILDQLARDIQVILARILGTGHRSHPLYPLIASLEAEVKKEFRQHKISRAEELGLLRHLAASNDYLRRVAAQHAAGKALSRDISGLLGEFAPKPRGPAVVPSIQALMNLVKKDQSQGLVSGRRGDWLTAWLGRENTRLEKLLGERARLVARMKTVQAYESSVAQAAQQQASLAGVISGLGGGPQSSATLLAGMRQQLAQIERFDSDIKRLSKLGLDRNLISQIVQMGPAQGSQVAEALINGPLANIASLNKTDTQIQKASSQLGNTAATAVYGTGRDFGKNLVKGLRSQEKAIDAEMARIARHMAAVLERELGLHKHRAHRAGAALIAAAGHGMTDRAVSDSALRSAAGYVPSALASAAAGAGGGGVTTVPIILPVTLELDGKVLYRKTQERSLRVDRRNGRNNLSLSAGRRR